MRFSKLSFFIYGYLKAANRPYGKITVTDWYLWNCV